MTTKRDLILRGNFVFVGNLQIMRRFKCYRERDEKDLRKINCCDPCKMLGRSLIKPFKSDENDVLKNEVICNAMTIP